MLTRNLADLAPLGPVIAHGFVTRAGGKQGHQHGGRVIWRMLKRTTAARLSGRWRSTPFFDDSGAPVAAPELAPRA